MKTINNIFQLFKVISENHYQINGFVYGDINEVESYDKLKYPLLITSPILSVVSENVITHTYRISVSDLVRKDEENQIEIWSDTQQILNDLIKIFRYDSVQFELIGEPILTPFKEKWGDDVSGWQADFEIQFDFDATECGVPIDSFLIPGPTDQGYFPSCIDVSSLCDVELTTPTNGQVLVYQSGIWVNQNQSGGGGGGGAVDSVNGLTGVVVLTTANIADSLNRRYITDALLAILNNTSGVNTGDQDLSAYALLSALSDYLPLAGGTMASGAIVTFTDSIDIQGGNVTDYSKAWIWSDASEMQMGFSSYSIIRAAQYQVVLQAQNSFIQIIETLTDRYIRLKTSDNANNTELRLNASTASEYISNTNNPLNYASDYSANFTDNSLITKKYAEPLEQGSLSFAIDGNGADIITGTSALLSSLIAKGVITNWYVEGEEASGSVVIDVQIWNGSSYVSIIGAGNKPTITTSKFASAAVSGWTSTGLLKNDRIRFVVESISNFTKVNLQVFYTKDL